MWIDNFETQLKLVDDLELETHFLGDFNINYYANSKTGKSFENQKWDDLINKYSFQQLIGQPTRISKTKSSIIDHIYSNTRDFIIKTNVPEYTMSDHLSVCFMRFSGTYQRKFTHRTITYRSFKHFSKDAFCEDLNKIDFSLIEMQTDIDTSISLFYNLLNDIISKHARVKQKRIRYDIQPGWFNDEIRNSIHERNTFYKKRDWGNYKLARNKINSLIRKSKINFLNKAIAENQNINYFWQHLKNLNATRSTSALPEVIENNNVTISDKTEIANIFNTHFVNISDIIYKENILLKNFSLLKESP
ncbi:hypothetical protein ACF0H5_016904 [Mactra antiquata]